MAGIALTREALDPEEINPDHVWYLKVTAESSEEGLTSKIFVYHAYSDDFSGSYPGDIFTCVASIKQMQDIPEDEPSDDPEDLNPFYRLAVFEAFFTNPEELEDAWNIIVQDTTALVRSHRLAAELEDSLTVNIDP
jgi:hypothetical protein